MTRKECILSLLAEECSEVIQRIFKVFRYGSEDVQEGQMLSNEDRITHEFTHVLAAYEMSGLQWPSRQAIDARKQYLAAVLIIGFTDEEENVQQ